MSLRPDLQLLASLAAGPLTWTLDAAEGEGARRAFEAVLEELQVLEVLGLVHVRTSRTVAWRPTVTRVVTAELSVHGERTLAGQSEEQRNAG